MLISLYDYCIIFRTCLFEPTSLSSTFLSSMTLRELADRLKSGGGVYTILTAILEGLASWFWWRRLSEWSRWWGWTVVAETECSEGARLLFRYLAW